MTKPIEKFDLFVALVHEVVAASSDEIVITQTIKIALEELLASGWTLEDQHTRPDPDRYVMYPLYIAEDESFSIAAAVWGVGQSTPVHGHETWGIVGIYSGTEVEVSYEKPKAEGQPLVSNGNHDWQPGQVTVCCTTEDDVHAVSAGGPEPCIGIHVYGTNIGTMNRRRYDPVTGEVSWFVSQWPANA